MEQSLKERLVGAAVLVVLAVIFVPMVLDGPETPPAPVPETVAAVQTAPGTFGFDLNAPLPAASGASVATVAVPSSVASTAAPAATPATAPTKPVAAPAPATATVKPVEKPAEKPVPTVTSGWAAQVGSFSSQATADGVAAGLKAKGFKAFVTTLKDGKRTLYRVRVGPVASREAADALAKKITTKTGQAARPVPHP